MPPFHLIAFYFYDQSGQFVDLCINFMIVFTIKLALRRILRTVKSILMYTGDELPDE